MIDGGVTGDNHELVDAADANALYRLLEEEVVPAFYERGADHVPHAWMATIKESIRTVAPRFCARRMVKEYVGENVRAGAGTTDDQDSSHEGQVKSSVSGL